MEPIHNFYNDYSLWDTYTSQNEKIYDEKLNELNVKENSELDKLREPCETCKNRRYQDVSSDSGVSFQSPQKIEPALAEAVVYGHEREHLMSEEIKAKTEDKVVLENRVSIEYAICDECGRKYVAGGVTTTSTKSKEETFEDEPQFVDLFV